MKRVKLISALFFIALLLWQCTFETEPVPDDCTGALSIALQTKSDASCGATDGTITVVATGTSTDLTYAIGGSTPQSSPTFNGLTAGAYIITVFEGDCSAEITVTIENQNGVNATTQANISECGSNNGSISVTAVGGVGPYEYKIGNGAFQSASTFADLAPNTYQVTVKDAGGCEVILQTKVLSDVDFGIIKSIVQNTCAVSGCHNGSQSPNFTSDSNIINNASRIQVRTGAKTMPPQSSGRSLSNDQISQIACWVADGASGN